MPTPLPEALPADVGLSAEGLARIDTWLAGLVASQALPGVSTLVARHGKVVHRSVAGVMDMASGQPLAFDTIFQMFSMTKPVMAAAMMILHDRGLWSPDDPIARHLPEFATVPGPGGTALTHPPTMGELMTHTAGFAYGTGGAAPDATDVAYRAAGVWKADGLAEFSRRLAAIPLAYQPGSAWRYSLSMDLQGAVLERLTGRTLPDFLREELFAPLGMVDTDFYVPAAKLPRLATLYHKYDVSELTVVARGGFSRDPRSIPPIPSGGGGLYATLGDYARFAQMLLDGGALGGVRILTPGSVALMTANHLPAAIIDRGVDAGFQRIGPGRGYAFNGAVYFDPPAAGSRVGRGTYQWDGASGVWFWIDPENDILFVGMIQRMLQDGMPRLQEVAQAMLAEAIIVA